VGDKIGPLPLGEQIAQAIRQAIFTGRLAAGSKIPQDELAEEFGVSRMPIREALVLLNYEGLVILEPRRGAWVAPLSLRTVDESYGLRLSLEPKAIELSVPSLDDDDLADLQQILTRMETAEANNQAERFVTLNSTFHLKLRSQCPWPKLLSFLDVLWKGFPPLTPQFVDQQMAQDHNEHRLLLEAAMARDGQQAADLMAQHIRRSWTAARQHFARLGWAESPSGIDESKGMRQR